AVLKVYRSIETFISCIRAKATEKVRMRVTQDLLTCRIIIIGKLFIPLIVKYIIAILINLIKEGIPIVGINPGIFAYVERADSFSFANDIFAGCNGSSRQLFNFVTQR